VTAVKPDGTSLKLLEQFPITTTNSPRLQELLGLSRALSGRLGAIMDKDPSEFLFPEGEFAAP